ncbi:WG repeat-containing protein [Klebsiella spallanzanii]|uniref:WG repeat-containing protein n=1 Tax=Klebsiella spallanzanii TaxID=2587528 RepID=UPI00115834F0|nr:WG repeat-containing protein [Klebsiella spallanzanii]VUS53315.1 hypothetical protein SB6419_03479 [Klebsiella spallanzanii]
METLFDLTIPVRYGQEKRQVYLSSAGEEKSFFYPHVGYESAPLDGGAPWLVVTLENGKRGFLSLAGEWIATPQFDDVRAFNLHGLARVCEDGKWGIVNRSGERVIPCSYRTLTPMVEGLSIAMTQQCDFVIVNSSGEQTTIQLPHSGAFEREWFDEFSPCGIACFHRRAGNRIFTGYIDDRGAFIIPVREGYGEGFSANGVAPFSAPSGKYGLIDRAGNWVVEPVYDLISHYDSCGFCCAQRWGDEEKCEFYNSYGERTFEIETIDAPKMVNGIVRSGGKGGLYVRYVNLASGKELTPELLSYGTDFYQAGAAIVRTQDGLWGILTTQGQFIHQRRWMEPLIDSENTIVGFSASNTVIFIVSRYELEYVSTQGKTVATLLFDDVRQIAVLKNAQNQVIRLFDYQNVWMPYLFFTASPAKIYPGEALSDAVNELIAIRPRPFVMVNKIAGSGAQFEGEEYDFNIDEVDEDEIKFGAIITLADVYCREEEWGEYEFLESDYAGWIKRHYQDLKTRLTLLFGEPVDEWPDRYCKWRVAKRRGYLTLQHYLEYGDGDFEKQVVLYIDDNDAG